MLSEIENNGTTNDTRRSVLTGLTTLTIGLSGGCIALLGMDEERFLKVINDLDREVTVMVTVTNRYTGAEVFDRQISLEVSGLDTDGDSKRYDSMFEEGLTYRIEADVSELGEAYTGTTTHSFKSNEFMEVWIESDGLRLWKGHYDSP